MGDKVKDISLESVVKTNPVISEEEAIKLTLESTDVDISEGMELGQLLVAQVGKTNEVRKLASGYVDRLNQMSSDLAKIKEDNIRLEQENLWFKSDSLYAIYFALNRKNNEAATSLNKFTLDLTADKDDKTFERFKMLTSMLPDLNRTIASLRNDYLRIGEDEGKEIEKKGVPLIEQKRDTGSGKGKTDAPSKQSKNKTPMLDKALKQPVQQEKPRLAGQKYEL